MDQLKFKLLQVLMILMINELQVCVSPPSAPRNTDQKKGYDPLIPPSILGEDYPLGEVGHQTVKNGRLAAQKILKGEDDRLLVVIGPCSIHDVEAAKDYGTFIQTF
jgi:phospho-2-dehydro-3-deoxyheptonate aldolase